MTSDELFQLRARLAASERILARVHGTRAKGARLLRCGECNEPLVTDVISVLRSLTPLDAIAHESSLGELAIPGSALASRINLQFFGDREVLAADDFADNHTVATLAYVVALHLATGH